MTTVRAPAIAAQWFSVWVLLFSLFSLGCQQPGFAPLRQRQTLDTVPYRPLAKLIPACDTWQMPPESGLVELVPNKQTYLNTAGQPSDRQCDYYTVAPGETLYKIAEKVLGDGKKWKFLFDANRSVLPDPDKLKPGTVLTIPAGRE